MSFPQLYHDARHKRNHDRNDHDEHRVKDQLLGDLIRYFFVGRGLNSLQILSWIAAGTRMCPDMLAELLAAREFLVAQHGYDANVLNAKITDPGDRNDSDDELIFLP